MDSEPGPSQHGSITRSGSHLRGWGSVTWQVQSALPASVSKASCPPRCFCTVGVKEDQCLQCSEKGMFHHLWPRTKGDVACPPPPNLHSLLHSCWRPMRRARCGEARKENNLTCPGFQYDMFWYHQTFPVSPRAVYLLKQHLEVSTVTNPFYHKGKWCSAQLSPQLKHACYILCSPDPILSSCSDFLC